jgi:predicted  nucleic acid-binding Zn-ribbon protein
MATEAQRKLEDSRKQTAQLQQQRHSLLQERKAAEEEVANMKLQLREARDALAASHRATKDVMIDYLRALRDAEARAMPHQGTHSETKKLKKCSVGTVYSECTRSLTFEKFQGHWRWRNSVLKFPCTKSL